MKIKKILIYVFCLFFTLSTYAEVIDIRRTSAVESINRYIEAKKINQATPRALRQAQRDVLQFNNLLVYGNNGAATDKSNRLNMEADIDYYTEECAHLKTKGLCDSAKSFAERYKKAFGADYKPKTPNYPEIDLEKYTYTIDGKTYDLKNKKYVSAAPKASTPTAKTTVSAVTTVSATAAASGSKETKTMPEYSCEWDNSLPPRKLLYAPGCSGSGKVCSGFVKCTKNGYKINRLATCGSEYCSDSSATECAKQKGYGSKTVTADSQAAAASSGSGSKQNRGGGVN